MKYLSNSNLKTYTSSFVAIKKKYLVNLPWYKNDHRYLPVISICRGAKKQTEIVIKHKKRKFGFSKYNKTKKIIYGIPEVILFILRLKLGFYSNR